MEIRELSQEELPQAIALAERVFLHKFQEALLLSSWGVMLLGSPLLLAYGVAARAAWYYYVLLPGFLVAFTAATAPPDDRKAWAL